MTTKNHPFRGKRQTLKERVDAAMGALESISPSLADRVTLFLHMTEISDHEALQAIAAGIEPYTDPKLGALMYRVPDSVAMQLEEECDPHVRLEEMEDFVKKYCLSRARTFQQRRREASLATNSAAIFGEEPRSTAWRAAHCIFWYLEAAEHLAFLNN